MLFVAPVDGWYTFSTVDPETDFDTVLHMRTDCLDARSTVGCYDSAPGSQQSGLSLNIAAGMPTFVVVDAKQGEGGRYGLNLIYAAENAAPALAAGVDFGSGGSEFGWSTGLSLRRAARRLARACSVSWRRRNRSADTSSRRRSRHRLRTAGPSIRRG